jgi:uncharacterized sulfatase
MKKTQLGLYLLVALLCVAPSPHSSPVDPDRGEDDLVKTRQALEDQFRKEIVNVTEGVYVAVGYGASNPTMIEGRDSLIIVDTMFGTEEAEHAYAAFRRITTKPIRAIIYTHSHTDHVGGASVFAKEPSADIYSRSSPSSGLARYDALSDVLRRRARRQFGSDLLPEEKISGIAPVHRPSGGIGSGKLKPSRIIDAEREKLTIAGVGLEIVSAPGETEDHLYVWLPEKRVLLCGDNYYFSFPNLYAIRGTSYRDISKWVASLDKMIQEDAEYLISGHARPITGNENVRRTLTDYRDAIDYVLAETLKGMNDGLSPDELAHSIKLPDSLAKKNDLREFYGVVEWSVRAIYSGYLGWFDGNPTNLFPLSPAEEAKRMATLIGSEERLIEEARKALASEDFQWACQLADYALELDPGSREVKRLKAEALLALADRQISSNARHYYLSV